MPGRLRTASSPSRTVIDSAPYSCFFCAATLGRFLAQPRRRPELRPDARARCGVGERSGCRRTADPAPGTKAATGVGPPGADRRGGPRS
jgi:hypothetical protein